MGSDHSIPSSSNTSTNSSLSTNRSHPTSSNYDKNSHIPPIQIPIKGQRANSAITNQSTANTPNLIVSSSLSSSANSYKRSSRVPLDYPVVPSSPDLNYNFSFGFDSPISLVAGSSTSTSTPSNFPTNSNNSSQTSLNTIIDSNSIPPTNPNSSTKSVHLLNAIDACIQTQSELSRKLIDFIHSNRQKQKFLSQLETSLSRLKPQAKQPINKAKTPDCEHGNEFDWDFAANRRRIQSQPIETTVNNINNNNNPSFEYPIDSSPFINYQTFNCSLIDDLTSASTHLAAISAYFIPQIEIQENLSNQLDKQIEENQSKLQGLKLRSKHYSSLVKMGCKIPEYEKHYKQLTGQNNNEAGNNENINSTTTTTPTSTIPDI